MITLILTLHLALAALYILAVTTIGLASIKRKALPLIARAAYVSFGAIIGSGTVLVVLSPKAMTQFCVSALIATVLGIVASRVYKHRVIAFHTSDNAVY